MSEEERVNDLMEYAEINYELLAKTGDIILAENLCEAMREIDKIKQLEAENTEGRDK